MDIMCGSPHVGSSDRLRRSGLRAGVSTGLVVVFTAWSLAGPEAGTQALDFTLETPDGESVSLEALRGRVVFLNFWATWCAPCREELPELDRLQATYDRDDFVILAVNVGEQSADVERFLDRHPLDALTVLLDSRFEVVSRYDPAGMPASFLIDGGGTIRYTHIGYTPKVLAEYRRQIHTLIEEP